MMKRRSMMLAATAVGLLLVVTGCMSPEETSGLSAVNGDRAANAVPAVSTNNDLLAKAQGWAAHLAASSGGQCSGATLVHSDLRDGAPGGWRFLGENVGCRIAPGDVSSFVAPMQASFMNSPAHRENILNAAFNSTGVAYATAPSSTPGYTVVYATQEFAQL
jgi:uncharacterized protein YkwD